MLVPSKAAYQSLVQCMLEVSSQGHMRVKQEHMKGREYRDRYNGLCAPQGP